MTKMCVHCWNINKSHRGYTFYVHPVYSMSDCSRSCDDRSWFCKPTENKFIFIALVWAACLSVIRLRIYVGLARNIVSSDRNWLWKHGPKQPMGHLTPTSSSWDQGMLFDRTVFIYEFNVTVRRFVWIRSSKSKPGAFCHVNLKNLTT